MKIGKRLSNTVLSLGLLLMLCGIAAAQKVQADYDKTTNFAQYHTYSWVKVAMPNDIWDKRVQDYVDKDLQAKGWSRVESGGDVGISAIGTTHERHELNTFYNDPGFGWGWRRFGPGFTTTTVSNYREGMLVLDMYDGKSKDLIYRGSAQDGLSDNPEKNANKLQKAVDKMFKKFPPKAKG